MSVPVYTYPCLTSTSTGGLFLMGISPASEGTLNVHKIDLTNINSPVASLYATQTDASEWTSTAQTACFPYDSSASSAALFVQFGSLSRYTNLRSTGTLEPAGYFPLIGFSSPKLFPFTGSSGSFDWFNVYSNNTDFGTSSAWTAARFNSTNALFSSHSYYTTQFPPSNPSVAVGTHMLGESTGFTVFFDKYGVGTIYNAQLSTQSLIGITGVGVLTLAKPRTVDMGGVTLSSDAIPVAIGSSGYLLDKASDGSTVMYTINAYASSKLQVVSVTSDVPVFSSISAATAVGGKIIIIGKGNSGTPIFNSFDTGSGAWTGPNLMKPAAPPLNLGAIIGGVVGGVVIIALIVFLVIRSCRNKGYKPTAVNSPPPAPTHQDPGKFGNGSPPVGPPPQQQAFVLPQQQQQQQQMQQQAYFQQQQPTFDPHQAHIPPTTHYPMPQPEPNPAVFPGQHYDPNQLQQQQLQHQQHQQSLAASPHIFQPQSTSVGSPTYTQAMYSPSTTAVSDYPQTLITPAVVPAGVSGTVPEFHPPPPHKAVPSNPQYTGPSFSNASLHVPTSAPSNPQFIPQAVSEYAQ